MANTNVNMVKRDLHSERVNVEPPNRKTKSTNNRKFTHVKLLKIYSFTFLKWFITIEIFNQLVRRELNNFDENYTMSLFNILITMV